jgi:hypothetical protein
VVPLFLYVGIKRDESPSYLFMGLGAMAAGIFMYHAYRAYTKLVAGSSAWVNWIHILLVVPLLAVIAMQRKNTSRKYFELLMMLGFAAAGYHGYYLVSDYFLA